MLLIINEIVGFKQRETASCGPNYDIHHGDSITRFSCQM